ncbi:MAG: hypothetical protein VKK42_25405 [Lyngbya sp.]|nr:hypothetical protein [Lyngbya sp.]
MFITKKGKFSCELSLDALNKLLSEIKNIATKLNTKNEIDEVEEQDSSTVNRETSRTTHYLRTEDILVLPLNSFLSKQARELVRRISQDFIRGHKLENNASTEFVYKKLIQLLGSKNFYTQENIDIKSCIAFFEALKKSITEDISSTKVFIVPVVGASLEKGQRCMIGSVEFTNTSDFVGQYRDIFDALKNSEYSALLTTLEDMYQKTDLIAQIKIKNRDSYIAKSATDEIMKRVYTLVRLILPRIGYQHHFFGTLGEEYLDTRYSFFMKLNDLDNVTSLEINKTRNRFSDNEINLLQIVDQYKPENSNYEKGKKWFSQCESIISKYVNGEDTTDFQKRVWTALYWLGETMVEREINSLIIKYATCLEALFNSREGGISEQISEFTAFVCGASKEERINIYDDVKNLYKLRSTAVHGGGTGIAIDDLFLNRIQQICESAVVYMSHYSCEDYWLNSKGYQNFIRYILREYRFSGS